MLPFAHSDSKVSSVTSDKRANPTISTHHRQDPSHSIQANVSSIKSGVSSTDLILAAGEPSGGFEEAAISVCCQDPEKKRPE